MSCVACLHRRHWSVCIWRTIWSIDFTQYKTDGTYELIVTRNFWTLVEFQATGIFVPIVSCISLQLRRAQISPMQIITLDQLMPNICISLSNWIECLIWSQDSLSISLSKSFPHLCLAPICPSSKWSTVVP